MGHGSKRSISTEKLSPGADSSHKSSPAPKQHEPATSEAAQEHEAEDNSSANVLTKAKRRVFPAAETKTGGQKTLQIESRGGVSNMTDPKVDYDSPQFRAALHLALHVRMLP